eukprot:CAMPEP_0172495528 /NCGR_PEP_ID=MMETSP1066-20121228/71451_1 /TAXON_ID=671091 /ORGANISM="Coscinodiscus wailesii, Strain CCMP2513" /LENGTH=434 /DNA_ID=CAMNT_0013267265 /DNA_START=57 /DNA_END=1361 /DNA_ORIENTATION=+
MSPSCGSSSPNDKTNSTKRNSTTSTINHHHAKDDSTNTTNDNTGQMSTTASSTAKITLSENTTGAEWEMTWPIWHMLPRAERKAIALRHGMKTIGEFEEYMSLHKAEEVSALKPYPNDLIYAQGEEKKNEFDDTAALQNTATKREATKSKPLEQKLAALDLSDDDVGDDDDDDTSIINVDTLPKLSDLSPTDLIKTGGNILLLPEELIHKIFYFLDVHHYYNAALVHPLWSSFTRTEHAYKLICTRCYLNQSRRKTLHAHKFSNSYRIMLTNRPRVRCGGGVYVLQYRSVKKIQRDMWTEIPVGAILETIYYRYFYFLEDGRVLYCLTSSPPNEMIRRFLKLRLEDVKDKQAIWGRYEVSKYDVRVWAQHDWCHVMLEMKIVPQSVDGRFAAMTFERHRTSSNGDFSDEACWNGHVVEFDVPSGVVRFLRDRRL